MVQIIDEIRREHVAMAKKLDALEAQLDVFDAGALPDWDVIVGVVDFFLDEPSKIHHPKEDELLRTLRGRDPAAAAAAGDLEAEHAELTELGRRFAELLRGVLNEAEMPRDAFPKAAREFIDRQREHMNMEETRFLPAAEAALKDAG